MFYDTTIKPASGVFGEWEASTEQPSETYEFESDLLAVIADNAAAEDSHVVELGTPDAEGVEDIRGRIHHEPARVFAMIKSDGSVMCYFGINEV